MTDQEYSYEDFQNQQREIEDETKKRPLIGNVESTKAALADYNSSDKSAINRLVERYPTCRIIRGDGNCFFRGFSFRLLELLVQKQQDAKSKGAAAVNAANAECDRIIAVANDAKDILGNVFGMQVFLIEDFFDAFVDVVRGIKSSEIQSEDQLRQLMLDQSTMLSDSIVTAMRFICSCQIRKNEDFAPFVDPLTVEQYCQQEVEVTNRESDQLHITAMSNEFGICIQVEYLDASGAYNVKFPDNGTPQIHLLFKPGHYDVLYPC